MNSDFTIRVASWGTYSDALRYIREKVFMEEQNVPEELELDGLDDGSVHLLASDRYSSPAPGWADWTYGGAA
jgi:hypothetical protein